jgi:hypothetical protein
MVYPFVASRYIAWETMQSYRRFYTNYEKMHDFSIQRGVGLRTMNSVFVQSATTGQNFL